QRPLTPIGAQMNIGYALAVAVLDGAALVPQFAPARIDADDVWALLPRIAVRHEPEFDAGGQRARARAGAAGRDFHRRAAYRGQPPGLARHRVAAIER